MAAPSMPGTWYGDSKDNLLFFEYFLGDLGAGLGAAHQTGWTALVADLILDPMGQARSIVGASRAR